MAGIGGEAQGGLRLIERLGSQASLDQTAFGRRSVPVSLALMSGLRCALALAEGGTSYYPQPQIGTTRTAMAKQK